MLMCIEDVMIIVKEPDHNVALMFCTSFNYVCKESDLRISLSLSPGLYRFIVYFCQP